MMRVVDNSGKQLFVGSFTPPAWKRECLFRFLSFIKLSISYLLGHLPAYLQPPNPHGACCKYDQSSTTSDGTANVVL